MVDRQKQQPVRKYRLTRTKLVGNAALGIPMYKDMGEAPRFFTGTNKEVNAFKKTLNESEHEAGIEWAIYTME